MYKMILAISLLFSLTACATTGTIGSHSTPPAIVSAQDAATQSLLAIGSLLKTTPKVLDDLYAAGKVSKADFNSIVPVYNRALASFNAAVDALNAAKKLEQDPTSVTAYVTALQSFLSDKAKIDNLMAAFGQASIGAGVSR